MSAPGSASDVGSGARRLVGRTREVAQLHAALNEALAGRGGVVLISGEAGIGKTTLAEQLATDAAVRGAVVVWGRCPEGQVAPPFTPWLQALRAWFGRATDPEAASALGPNAASVARLLPELADRLGVEPAPEVDDAGARFRLIEAVGEAVARAGRVRPLVVVLDDLHAADASSLAVAESVGRAIIDAAVLVVGAHRERELEAMTAESMHRLLRLPRSRHLPLPGLDTEAVRLCLEDVTGRAVATDRAAAVWDRTGGNPYFVVEVARLPEGADEVPSSVRGVLRARLAGLEPDTVRLLVLAAVLGRQFDDVVLADADQTSVPDVLDRLEPTVDARLVEQSSPGQHRFVHELVREALLADMTAADLARLHGEVGESIERRAGPALDEHLDVIALHYAEAAIVGQTGRAVDYLELAAARARRLLAHFEAAAHLERACAIAAADDAIAPDRRCDLLLAAGNAWTTVSQYDKAAAAFSQAMDVARFLHDYRRLAAAAIGHVGPARLQARAASIPLLDEALAAVPADEEVLRCWLMACRADATSFEQSHDGRAQAEAAWRLATALDDPLARVLAARALCWLSFTPEHLPEAVQLAEESLRAARRLGDLGQLLPCHALRMLAAIVSGDLAALDRIEEERRVDAEHTSGPSEQMFGLIGEARRHLFLGDFESAEQSLRARQELDDVADGPRPWLDPSVGQLVWLRWWQGRGAELRHSLDSLVMTLNLSTLTMRIFAALLGLQADDPAARSILEGELPNLLTPGYSPFRSCDLALTAELALALDARAAMVSLEGAIAPWSGLHASWTLGFHIGPLDLHLGRLRTAIGDERAVDTLERALCPVEAAGARPLVMTGKAALADALRRRGGTGDDLRARALLLEAAELARELSLPDRARQYEAGLLEGTGPHAAGLSGREADVLRLIATGASNQQIASTLHLSVKTVERHLSNLYRKLDVTNRTEAAAYALRQLGE